MTVRVEGMDTLKRKLAALPDAVAGNVLLQSVMQGGKPVHALAETRAPRRRRGNRIRQKVVIQELDGNTRHHAAVGIGPDKYLGVGIFFQEIGTRFHPANPWLRPAFDEKVGEARETIRRELQQRIEIAAAHG